MIQPTCFSKSWDPKTPACKGGLDPAYTNPRDGSHHRERCSWFIQCGQTQSTNQSTAGPNIVPTAMLNPHNRSGIYSKTYSPNTAGAVPPRPPAPPTPPRPTNTYNGPYGVPHQTVHPPQASHHYPTYAPYAPMVHPYVAQQGPQAVAAPHQMPTAQVPYYLTIPEPLGDGDSFWRRLIYEIIRSLFKASGHTIASFFDHNPLKRYKVDPNKYNIP